MKKTTTIVIEKKKDDAGNTVFSASCANDPVGQVLTCQKESVAVSNLINQIRKTFEAADVQWIESPVVKPNKQTRVIQVAGVWPKEYQQPAPPQTNKDKEK